jgi:hypothetical protein
MFFGTERVNLLYQWHRFNVRINRIDDENIRSFLVALIYHLPSEVCFFTSFYITLAVNCFEGSLTNQVGIEWAYDVLDEMKRLWEYATGCNG